MTLLELLQTPAVDFVIKSGRQPEIIVRSKRDGIEFWVERTYLEDQDDGTKQLVIEVSP